MGDSVIRHETLGPLPILAMTREPDTLTARRRTASPRNSPGEDGGGFVPLSGNRHAS